MTHNNSVTSFSQLLRHLMLEKEQQGFQLVQMLIWLSLVSAEHAGSNATDMTKHIIIIKHKVINKKRKGSHRDR